MNHKIEQISLEKLQPYRLNAKLHPEEQLEKIGRSFDLTGIDQPIVVNNEDGELIIVKGHGRWEAAKRRGLKEVPCIVLNVEKDIADKARLLDNKSAESDYDLEVLLKELTRFQGEIEDTGYKTEEFEEFLLSLEEEFSPENDEGEIDEEEMWSGMPDFENEEQKNYKSIIVHFLTEADYTEFADLVEQNLTEKTKYIYYPKQQKANLLDMECRANES